MSDLVHAIARLRRRRRDEGSTLLAGRRGFALLVVPRFAAAVARGYGA